MQFIVVTVDERDLVVVVDEEDDDDSIRDWVSECFFYNSEEVNLGKRTATCLPVIHALGLMHFDIMEIKDESELLEDSWQEG